jgi:hypothetical protein
MTQRTEQAMIERDDVYTSEDQSARTGQLTGGRTDMTEAEQLLSLVAGGLLVLWALRHGRLLPSLALAAAAPMLVAGVDRRWPAILRPALRARADAALTHRRVG